MAAMQSLDAHVSHCAAARCLQRATSWKRTATQQEHPRRPKLALKDSRHRLSHRQTSARAEMQETLTSDGPSVPEILQTKCRRIRVNYIRRDGAYEVNRCRVSLRPEENRKTQCLCGAPGLGPPCLGGRAPGDRLGQAPDPAGVRVCTCRCSCGHLRPCMLMPELPLLAGMPRRGTTSRWTWCRTRRRSTSITGSAAWCTAVQHLPHAICTTCHLTAPATGSGGSLTLSVFCMQDQPTVLCAGDDKDAGGEIVEIRDEVPELWLLEGSKRIFFQQPDIAALPRGDLTKCAAHW